MSNTSLAEAMDRKVIARESNRYAAQAWWSRWTGGVAIPVVIIAVALHRLGWLDTVTMAASLVLACLIALVAVGLAGASVVAIGRHGQRGLMDAGIGLAYGLAVLAIPAWAFMSYIDKPTLNDVTTDPTSPISFQALAEISPLGRAPYNREFGPLQRTAYPSIVPLRAAFGTMTVYEEALAAAEDSGWQIIDALEPVNELPGQIEAVATTMLFGFDDDVVIVIDFDGEQTRVDMRSRSRFGKHDLGANAKRVDMFLTDLANRLASLPIE